MSKDVIHLTGKAAVAAILFALVLSVAALAVPAFVLMLALGALHSLWPVIPALGFWAVYYIVLIVSLVGSFFRS